MENYERTRIDLKTGRRIIGYLSTSKSTIVNALLLSVLAGATQLLAPFIIGKAIDNAIGTQYATNTLVKYLAILLVLYILAFVFSWMLGKLSTKASLNCIEKMRVQAFEKLMHSPIKEFDMRQHGDIMARLSSDIDTIHMGLQQSLLQLISGIVIVFGSLIALFFINPIIALVVLVITPVAIIVARIINQKSGKYFRQSAQRAGNLNSIADESIQAKQEILLYGQGVNMQKEYEGLDERLYRSGQKSQFYSSLVNPSTRLINNSAYIAVGVIGGLLALSGKITIGGVASVLTYATQFAKPINEVASVTSQLQAAMASSKRVFEIIDIEPEKAGDDLPDLVVSEGKIEFDNVDFSYITGRPFIENLSFYAKAGQKIAIVGGTGSGKTTLVNLLMRFYDISSGEIKIDGQNIEKLKRNSVRKAFAMVLQDTWLFDGSIRDNIAYGKENASEAEIINAAKIARADRFIRRIPDGYDAKIKGGGNNLSEGQRQLISIARAMLNDTNMLILDEATSNVDNITEIQVKEAFEKAMNGRTSIVIAHRLSTIMDSNCILVMDGGKIVEKGTHDELMNAGGKYASLYNSQFRLQYGEKSEKKSESEAKLED